MRAFIKSHIKKIIFLSLIWAINKVHNFWLLQHGKWKELSWGELTPRLLLMAFPTSGLVTA